MAICAFGALRERDMDLMFLETIASDKGFIRLLVDATGRFKDKVYEVECIENIELSNYDAELGESDITVILKINGERYGFLIEDKINAVAMPNQCKRYVERAEKAKAEGRYDNYCIFIFCPNKYHKGNSEAKNYTYHLSYEDCRDYFKKKDDPISKLRVEQLEQAINKSRSSDITINANANAFFRAYAAYKDEHFPSLKLTTKLDKNGYWPQYASALKGSYILHKLNFGCVDLQIKNAATKINIIEEIVNQLKKYGLKVEAVTESNVKSAIIRCRTEPEEINKTLFSDVSETVKKEWFEAIELIAGISSLIENIKKL